MEFRRRKALAIGSGLALALIGAVAVFPAAAQPPPIAIEVLSPRSEIPDAVGGQVRIKLDGRATNVINMKDLSRTVVAKVTVQPGAVFPWHTHAGPVVVNIAEGLFVWVSASDCVERPYSAGQAFVDPGHGHIHTGFNPSGGEVVVFYATFFQVGPAPQPLTLTEGVATPDCVITP